MLSDGDGNDKLIRQGSSIDSEFLPLESAEFTVARATKNRIAVA